MSKQKEIREVLELWDEGGCLYRNVECANRSKDPLTHQLWCRNGNDLYICLMKRLDKLGVVIKVARVLPKFYTSKMPTAVDREGLECSFVEPLIEGVKNGLVTRTT